MLNWVINILSGKSRSLTIGSRVQTRWGMGTVTGGCIHVDLDGYSPRKNHGVNLEELTKCS